MNEQGGGPEPQRDRWSPQDSRTWIITFGATLAANLATVLIVAAAVVELHWERGIEPHHRIGTNFWAADVGILLNAGILGVAALSWRRRRGAYSRVAVPVLGGLAVLAVLWVLLDVVGAAAGIK